MAHNNGLIDRGFAVDFADDSDRNMIFGKRNDDKFIVFGQSYAFLALEFFILIICVALLFEFGFYFIEIGAGKFSRWNIKNMLAAGDGRF